MGKLSNPKDILKQYWGYDSFRPLQEDIVNAAVSGKSVLALLPTGGGKSICFQVPGLCMDGICIVISPLIALMKDQVEQLRKRGIKASAIYSGMNKKEIDITLDNCIYGDMKFLYVSPERIKTELFLARAEKMNISMLAVDEAHCISQWGYDFRPPYLEINEFIKALNIKRVIALTASATKAVKEDIMEKLGMENAQVFRKSFARANLSYSAFQLENKEQKMLEILTNVPGSSVVYVRSRKQTKELAEYLRANGISASFYHAGLPGHVRSARQDEWISGKIRVIVATNAFGMGIDKPDVRTVIHFELPDSLEAYYQEAGRAGRDEKKAYAVLLFGKNETANLVSRAEQSIVSVEFLKKAYQSLANFYKLAVGSEAFTSFPFDLSAFTKNYELSTIETYHALNQLSEEGLVQMTEAFRESSKIIFSLDQSEIYRYQVAHGNMDALIKVLMRLYGGELFLDFVSIKEEDIAALLKVPHVTVVQQLQYLHQSEVIIYHEAHDKPRITFLTPRMDANNLPLDENQIEWRRGVAISKAKKMVEYATNEMHCKTSFIQKYFDDDEYKDCGVCDRCIAKHKAQMLLPLKKVEAFIAGKPKTETEIIERFQDISENDLVASLRTLMDMKRITLTMEESFIKID
ncbi:MAG: ATP-dependent DNA helicase RecQ [Marinoscillum sp.]